MGRILIVVHHDAALVHVVPQIHAFPPLYPQTLYIPIRRSVKLQSGYLGILVFPTISGLSGFFQPYRVFQGIPTISP